MDIDGLGEKLIEQFLTLPVVKVSDDEARAVQTSADL